ncbi:MAG: membrane-bound lytic murein transglycosylase MltF, partial [Gammaproteobacteria bacterium]|nr:membrane-bound lytic murein transglycosylase MltF [Gammaproteobacteria bacterium]
MQNNKGLLQKLINHFWLWLIFLLAVSGAYYVYYQLLLSQHTVLDKIIERGEIVIATRNAPTTYYEIRYRRYAGIEYDMALAFAKYLNVKPRFVIKDTVEDIFMALDKGEVDIAASGLTVTDAREEKYLFGPSYQSVNQKVICHRKAKHIPKSMDDFKKQQLHVSSGTSYAEQLNKLQKDHPTVMWQKNPEWDTEFLLQKVHKRKLDCTIADSNIFAVNQRHFPELTVAFDLTEDAPLAWVMRKESENLRLKLNIWFGAYKDQGQLDAVVNRYYGHIDEFDYFDTKIFRQRIKKRFPKYRTWFKQAARKYKIDWRLLAAQSYQESHWNRKAKSPTGVRGIMMLTQATAKELGVKSRLDAKANIFAGAKYFIRLRKRLPKDIKEPDRTWM